MGNKSKTNGAKQSAKWAQRRDMAKARQPKKWNQWGGLTSPSVNGGLLRSLVHNSTKAGTLRNAKPLNSHTGL